MSVQPVKPPPFTLIVELDDGRTRDLVLAARSLAGVSQAAFARLMGVSGSTLCYWESGRSPVPAWAGRAAVCAALIAGVSIHVPHPAKYLTLHKS